MIDVCIFPASLKTANITPVYKKGSQNEKKKNTGRPEFSMWL